MDIEEKNYFVLIKPTTIDADGWERQGVRVAIQYGSNLLTPFSPQPARAQPVYMGGAEYFRLRTNKTPCASQDPVATLA